MIRLTQEAAQEIEDSVLPVIDRLYRLSSEPVKHMIAAATWNLRSALDGQSALHPAVARFLAGPATERVLSESARSVFARAGEGSEMINVEKT